MAAAVVATKTCVRNKSEETVVVLLVNRVKEDIAAAKPLVVRILKPGKWFTFKRRREDEEEECHGYICLASQAFRLNTWVSFDAAAVWAARSAEIRTDEMGALQLLPLHNKLDGLVKVKNPLKNVTCIISEIGRDVTMVILDRAKEEGEACSLVFVTNVIAGGKSELDVKSVFGNNLERVNEVHTYLMLTPHLFNFDNWVSFPAKTLTDGDFLISPSRLVATMFGYRSKKRNRLVKSRGFTWARANFTR